MTTLETVSLVCFVVVVTAWVQMCLENRRLRKLLDDLARDMAEHYLADWHAQGYVNSRKRERRN